MESLPYQNALIVGAGSGISASLARALAAAGLKVGLAARNVDKLADLAAETEAETFAADASDAAAVEQLFEQVDARLGAPDLVIYNASGRLKGSLLDLDPAALEDAVAVSATGAFFVAQQAARRMVPAGKGAIVFTGATASIKGFSHSAGFAMGKFALRGLAESAARELMPKGIHIAHFVIDGAVRSAKRAEPADSPDSMLDPDAIAKSYLAVLAQPRSAWTNEITLRPWVETF